ncbi:MAG: immunoglobulin domain-containing protein [Candidatus Kapabacteria bacterium]|nr:immunoglobulin domain-containing protein [Candidatus Kapabacteria bacterium]
MLSKFSTKLFINSLILFFAIIGLAVLSQSAKSKQDGSKTGLTSSSSAGCAQSCHASGPNSETTLSIASDNGQFTTTTGSELTFTLTIACSGKSTAGCDIAVKTTQTGGTNAGTLAPITGEGLQLYGNSGELTHSSPKAMSNGSVTFRFTWTAPSSPGTYYLRAVGNATNDNHQSDNNDLWNWLNVTSITVTQAPSITLNAPSGGEAWCQSSSHNITWSATNVSTCKIELSSDGGSSFPTLLASGLNASTGSYNWSISSGLAAGNQYKIKISDESNAATNGISAANFTISGPTSISSQPNPITACTGLPASFSVTASGGNLSYQWRKGGTNIPGAINSTYTINSVLASDAGSFDCVVSGACGSATSSAAILTVNVSPTISQQPSSALVCLAANATFYIEGTATNPVYKWQKNGADITGAPNSKTFTIINVSPADAGNYTCTVNGTCTTPLVSQPATLTVVQSVSITSQPLAINACESSASSLSVLASGQGMKYLWYKDGNLLSNQTTSQINFASLSINDAGTYQVTVKDGCGNLDISQAVIVSVIQKPSISVQPSDQVVSAGAVANFSVTAIGTGLNYQWRKDGLNLSGKTDPVLQVKNVSVAEIGNYDCIITNNCGSLTSNIAKLTISSSNAPILTLTNSVVNFPNTLLANQNDTILKNIVTNSGVQDLIITAITINGSDASQFILNSTSFPLTIKKAESKDINISFKPTSIGLKNAKIDFASNAPNNPSITLNGTAGTINFTLSNTKLDFTTSSLSSSSSKEFSITNNGNFKATLNYIISGQNASEFSSDLTQGINIDASKTIKFNITYLAQSVINANAALIITCAENGQKINIPLNGQVMSSVFDENISNEDFRVYPNPATNMISFESLKEFPLQIIIIDIYGQEIAELSLKAGEKFDWNACDANSKPLTTGIYNIVTIINNKKSVEKISIIK